MENGGVMGNVYGKMNSVFTQSSHSVCINRNFKGFYGCVPMSWLLSLFLRYKTHLKFLFLFALDSKSAATSYCIKKILISLYKWPFLQLNVYKVKRNFDFARARARAE